MLEPIELILFQQRDDVSFLFGLLVQKYKDIKVLQEFQGGYRLELSIYTLHHHPFVSF